jgi:hypothetical protein
MQESSKVSSSGLIAYAILSHVFGLLAVFFGIMVYVDGPRELWRAISYVCLIPVIVFNCLILHRGWKAVQDGKAQTTPGKAVGFMFIPFFNLYWGFVAWHGLMQEFNRLAVARGRLDQKVGEGMAMTVCVLQATICLSVFSAPFGVVVLWQIIGAVRDIERS